MGPTNDTGPAPGRQESELGLKGRAWVSALAMLFLSGALFVIALLAVLNVLDWPTWIHVLSAVVVGLLTLAFTGVLMYAWHDRDRSRPHWARRWVAALNFSVLLILLAVATVVVLLDVRGSWSSGVSKHSSLSLGACLLSLLYVVAALLLVGVDHRLVAFAPVLLIAVLALAGLAATARQETLAAFSTLAGRDRIETAERASLAWTPPPAGGDAPTYVEVPSEADDDTVAQAAGCAVLHDVPLMFRPVRPSALATYRAYTDRLDNRPSIVLNKAKELSCPGWPQDNANPGGCPFTDEQKAPVLQEAIGYLQESRWPTCAPYMATPKTPSHLVIASAAPLQAVTKAARAPDVMVGLVLARHLKAQNIPVALLPLPAVVEGSRELEDALRKDDKPVVGGVVVGGNSATPDATRTLVRSLLIGGEKQDLFDRLTSVGESTDKIIAAFVGLLGLTAVAAATSAPAAGLITGTSSRTTGASTPGPTPVTPPGPPPGPRAWPFAWLSA